MNIACARTVVPLSLLALCACEFFHTTTVPAVDTSAPWAVVSVYDDGEHEELRLGNMTLGQAANTRLFDRATTDPYKAFIALAAGVDGGGVRQVEMHSRVYGSCLYGAPNTRVIEPWRVERTSRTGSPGDTVDDGLYVARAFRGIDYLHQVDDCSEDAFKVTLEWSARAWDFSNNFASYGSGRVTYVKYGS